MKAGEYDSRPTARICRIVHVVSTTMLLCRSRGNPDPPSGKVCVRGTEYITANCDCHDIKPNKTTKQMKRNKAKQTRKNNETRAATRNKRETGGVFRAEHIAGNEDEPEVQSPR